MPISGYVWGRVCQGRRVSQSRDTCDITYQAVPMDRQTHVIILPSCVAVGNKRTDLHHDRKKIEKNNSEKQKYEMGKITESFQGKNTTFYLFVFISAHIFYRLTI